MRTETLVQILDQASVAHDWFRSLGIEDTERAHANLISIAQTNITLDLVQELCTQLEKALATLSDPGRVLNNLDRFFASSRSPLALGSLFERDPQALPTLLQIFSTSQYLADLLIRDPESFDLLRLTEGQPIARQVLVDEICSEALAASDRQAVLRILRRYKHRETLRIAYGDIIREQSIAVVTKQISYLADAVCEAAYRVARRTLEQKHGEPRYEGKAARYCILALGKLGGEELNYSSDIDLVLLSDGDGQTSGPKSISNAEFFERLTREFSKLLAESTPLGIAYRVDLRLRPQGAQGPQVNTLQAALRYYDVYGRTWERQAFVKARAIAGDLELGQEFLEQIESWIYRRYLSRAEIAEIKALKRRIEQRAIREGSDELNLKTGRGGIRDIEFVIQFLQLLNGSDLSDLRTGNTLQAITRLEQVGCLTMQERSLLETNYTKLRKIEHRLQIMFDLQTHSIPTDPLELAKLAIRAGYSMSEAASPLEQIQRDLRQTTDENRRILDHLLHDAFADDPKTQPESDLVLDPHPSEEHIEACLRRYHFRDVTEAYHNLMALAQERISFLSTRRCRHFLASIAPKLLQAIASTPDPDSTLVNLSKVSDSLGGKGVLWELFSFNPPTLNLYVQLCASSSYLSGLLTSHPGMIDELMDSLVLDRLPRLETLQQSLAELCRHAEDEEPILHSFKNAQHLHVGVRDILGKEDVRDTHRALSDIAEACLRHITQREFEKLTHRFGVPLIGEGPRTGEPCELIILALGKLGGREPNYHSDLDIVFVYQQDGSTSATRNTRRQDSTSNQHFFSQLGQRIIKAITQMGPYGRLYEVDPRLRPTGKSGSLAVSLPEFRRYFAQGDGALWERQALCKSRVVFGSPAAADETLEAIREAIVQVPFTREAAEEIRAMRYRLEQTATPRNLKRGIGGTVDIEFAVQMLQLSAARQHPQVLVPGTLDAIEQLRKLTKLSDKQAALLDESYRFLRSVESRLRLMNTAARHDLPSDEMELRKLAFLLKYQDVDSLIADCQRFRDQNRQMFQSIFDQVR